MGDDLGHRMKGNYENRFRYELPRRTYTIIRIDGKTFHTYTRSFKKPFDPLLVRGMQETARHLCKNIQGAKLSYTQSDEISIVLTDFDELNTDAWFGGNIQKMVSISASMATAIFNDIMKRGQYAYFDSRVFIIPEIEEVVNYLIWRQQDATRNSIQMLARSLYSHNECKNKNTNMLQEMTFQKGKNWNDLSTTYKRGSCCIKNDGWEIDNEIPIFTKDRDYIKSKIFPKKS